MVHKLPINSVTFVLSNDLATWLSQMFPTLPPVMKTNIISILSLNTYNGFTCTDCTVFLSSTRSRQSKTTQPVWCKAIQRHRRRPWASLKWGGHSGLESTSNTKVVLSRWQHHVLKTCRKMSVSASPLLCWHIFRLLWLHSEPHNVVRPEYLGATLILCLSLTFFTLKIRERARRVGYMW